MSMSFLDLARKRFSVRVFQSTPVSEELINKVLEAGRLAPTAANRQPLHMIVVSDEEQRRRLNIAYPRDWFWKTPVVIIVCVEPAKAWVRADGKNYADVDGSIAMDHMTLCAADLGLGTCWIAAFDTAKVKSVLNLPEGIEPLAMTPLGHHIEQVREKSRKPLSDLVHQNTW